MYLLLLAVEQSGASFKPMVASELCWECCVRFVGPCSEGSVIWTFGELLCKVEKLRICDPIHVSVHASPIHSWWFESVGIRLSLCGFSAKLGLNSELLQMNFKINKPMNDDWVIWMACIIIDLVLIMLQFSPFALLTTFFLMLFQRAAHKKICLFSWPPYNSSWECYRFVQVRLRLRIKYSKSALNSTLVNQKDIVQLWYTMFFGCLSSYLIP